MGKEIPDYERDYLIDRQINVLEDGVSDEAKRRERSIVAKYKKINEKQKRGLPISDEERLSDEETKLLKLLEFRNKEWATKYTGGLYSLTGRAAAQGMRLGGLGDFYLERLLNIQRWFKGHRGLRRTEGIWKGVGKFEGNPFDMGLRDPLTDMLKEAEDENLQYLQGLGLNNVDFIKVKDEVGEEINKIDKIISLEHVKIGSKDLWQELLDKRLKTYEGVVGVNADYEAKAEVTRKVALLPYLLNPTDEKLIALQDYFEHMGTGEEKVGFTRKNGELVAGKTEKVSGIETKHIELGERTLEWMRADKNAPESIEALKYSKLQEYLNLIDLMSKEELISNERRDFLYKEYLGTSIKTWAQTKTQVDQMVGFIFRNPETRALNISNFLSNLLKRLFGYVFQEEAR
ncbi:hypothetical protein A2714_03040 [Candidatus Woesebacteria bacterium RIFCSPHIGHO2_01_FULL_38_9]|uniref:Uncharacterized protein n=1 Tax=Candidatus Woesebacteria bacterium RIFCSPHIGHO2_01_FULL_38_9 TaxID=1802492 RepID=A0A1F7Y1H6_9BACT|nr:MAG: hypothetical protein A2714_03040 [Candidatus Woesebacteria bacterium RIFCSPHIGHO2_01_FULL_38_9]